MVEYKQPAADTAVPLLMIASADVQRDEMEGDATALSGAGGLTPQPAD